MDSALDGITVLDLTEGPAGAQATMFLCDHGAKVTRVVDTNGIADRRDGYLVWDRGKELLRLDLSDIRAFQHIGSTGGIDQNVDITSTQATYERLVRDADVLVESFSPSSGMQAAVDYEWLASVNPQLVHCSITAYGKNGPLRDEPPIDDLVMARAGILSTQPGFRPAPVHVVHPLPSVGAALLAAQGITASLLARETTGFGRKVDTSLLAGALLYHPKVTGEYLSVRPFQTHPSGSAPFYSVYECSDGRWLQLGCVHRGFIMSAASVMGIKDIVTQSRFGDATNIPNIKDELELRELVAKAICSKPYDEWLKLFEEKDIPFAPAQETEAAMDDPQISANDMVVNLLDPEIGSISQMGVPVQLSETRGYVRGPRQAASRNQPFTYEKHVSDSNSETLTSGTRHFPPPLDGIRVLEITNLIAGPMTGRLLADLGADVVKMEPLDGDIARPIQRNYFFNVNVNKRSLSVNTKTPEGKEVARSMAARSDILLANLRPNATDRMGIGADVLREINPKIIEVHVTGYGWTGPYSHRPGIDPLAQALMGLEKAQGGPDNPPVFSAQLAPTDFTTGALGALGAILALFVRRRTGLTQRVDTNLINGGVVLSSEFFTRYKDKPQRILADKGQYGLDAFHRLYQAEDGWFYIVVSTIKERLAVCRLLGRNDLSDQAQMTPTPSADSSLGLELARLFSEMKISDCLDRLKGIGVNVMPAVDGDSKVFLTDRHAIANDMVARHKHPVLGTMEVARHYIQLGSSEVVAGLPTPLLGEHTQKVLEEVGFSKSHISQMYSNAVVHTEEP